MSKFELMVAKWLARRVVVQGNHQARIVALYGAIYREARCTFYEDNDATLHSFMLECFERGSASVQEKESQ